MWTKITHGKTGTSTTLGYITSKKVLMVPNIYTQQLSIHSGEKKNQKQNETKKIMTQMTTSRIPLNL